MAKSLTDGLIIAFVARIEADTLTIYQMLNIRVWARKKRWKWRSDPGKVLCRFDWQSGKEGFVQIYRKLTSKWQRALAGRLSWLARVLVGEKRVKYCLSWDFQPDYSQCTCEHHRFLPILGNPHLSYAYQAQKSNKSVTSLERPFCVIWAECYRKIRELILILIQ